MLAFFLVIKSVITLILLRCTTIAVRFLSLNSYELKKILLKIFIKASTQLCLHTKSVYTTQTYLKKYKLSREIK